MEDNKKYGVKVAIISEMDYDDMKCILNAIQALGYKITMIDNGNAVCETKHS